MKSCLIVEGSGTTRKVLRGMVEDLGLAVTEASDAREALLRCADRPPDLVVLDGGLPESDNLELMASLCRSGRQDTPKILVCASRFEPLQIQSALNAGADDYVSRPLDSDILGRKLQGIGVLPAQACA